MRQRAKRASRWKRLLGVLLCVSLGGLLLPESITGRLINLVQVLVPLQAGATIAADRLGEVIARDLGDVPAHEHERVLRNAQALGHMVASLSARVAVLEESNRRLTGLRERGLGPEGVLIPAHLVAGDVLGWRRSGLLDAGTLRGVQPHASVSTRTLGLDIGTDAGARDGMSVLAGEVLVGWVEHAGTHTARVKLLSDPTCRMPVVLGRFEGSDFFDVPPDEPAEFWLVGGLDAGLRIVDVDHRYVDGEVSVIRTGDVVMSSPGDLRLPLSLTIGTVSGIELDPDNGLLYILTVESAVPERLREVYVLNLDRS